MLRSRHPNVSMFLCIKTDKFGSFVRLSPAYILRFMEIFHPQFLLQMFSWVLVFYLVVLFLYGNSERLKKQKTKN